MKILIHPDAGAATECAAGLIAARLARDRRTVLGLATGGTMEDLYRRLIRRHHAGECSFAEATSFNLDEYVGLSPTHPCSYWHYMRHHLFDHVDLPAGQAHLPRGNGPDPQAEADRYENAIAAAGDIGLQLLGLGPNGHIGFNEPGSSLSSLTRVKTLARATIEANSRYFDRPEDVPRRAITMGIGTILRAQEVVLLAVGPRKAEVAARMIEGPVTAFCPASVLQFHRNCTVVLDAEAASELALRSYYEDIHPSGS
ncbi:glucosamine-6-phosphate deaminase [Falsirhodobacter deserti]|uniref:glucosamine-6-phosphate deaminase n=1 Tax=Falsirhodobacter deserti TaxID=1365611 RepID=UPI000FE34748|nr:glucosamine-6-phosphate deaminase [Falsirhodobacter deserti]